MHMASFRHMHAHARTTHTHAPRLLSYEIRNILKEFFSTVVRTFDWSTTIVSKTFSYHRLKIDTHFFVRCCCLFAECDGMCFVCISVSLFTRTQHELRCFLAPPNVCVCVCTFCFFITPIDHRKIIINTIIES